MKLVDILALDLKIWPEGLGDIVGQASDGTLHGENDVGPILWTDTAYTLCDGWIMDVVTRAQWQAAVDALKAEKDQKMDIDWSNAPEGATHYGHESEWLYASWYKVNDGEITAYNEFGDEWIITTDTCVFPSVSDLIPIQKQCAGEAMPPIGSHVVVVDDGTLRYGQGESGEVLAHVDSTVVIRMSYGLGCFLPRCLRSKEQIEADERDTVLNHMVRSIKDHPHKYQGVPHLTQLKIQEDACIDLFAAGYRKFEIVDKDDGEGEA